MCRVTYGGCNEGNEGEGGTVLIGVDPGDFREPGKLECGAPWFSHVEVFHGLLEDRRLVHCTR